MLEMTVEEGLEFFRDEIARKLQTINDVGSGVCENWPACHHAFRRRGPARQAGHRAVPPSHRKTIYILDEPTTGFCTRMCTS